MPQLCVNGNFLDSSLPAIMAGNKGYRYGDGFFETIRICNATIPLAWWHMQRIEKSIATLVYTIPMRFSITLLFDQVITLCRINNCESNARVRISFSNGEGGLFDEGLPFHYIIEATECNRDDEPDLRLGIFDAFKKDINKYAGLKSANSLLYSLSAQFAKTNQWHECIIFNTANNVIETTISNLFWIKNKVIYTTPIEDGCVAGVMRAYLLEKKPGIIQQTCTINDLKQADEIFLTNALRGIRPVTYFEKKAYQTIAAKQLYQECIIPLFH